MKSTVAATTALALALAATTASAGVVISQKLVNQTGAHKTNQTVMVQGHKQKIITGDQEIVTDLDAGMMYFIRPKTKQFFEAKFPPTGMLAMKMIWEGSTVELKKTDSTRKVAGYACQDYTGSASISRHNLDVTKCVASDAPGAKEFVEFQKAMAQKLEGTTAAPKGEIPDGIPVSSTTTSAPLPFTPPRGFPPEQAARLNAAIAKYKPATSHITVSKIEVKDIPADTFVVSAGYTKGEAQEQLPPQLMSIPRRHPATPGTAPAAPTAPAPH
jgi:hypothetical protein